MESSSASEASRLLREAARGDAAAADALFPVVYAQLHALAKQRMATERPGHTLQATALVHEAYLRLVGKARVPPSDRSQFLRAAAQAMRRFLVEHARRKGRLKRGGGRDRQPLDALDLGREDDPSETLALEEALRRLEERDPRMAEVVNLRFFAGLSVEETAEALDLSPRTVKREWTYARAWLYRSLADRGESKGAAS